MNRESKTAAEGSTVLKKLLCASLVGALGVLGAPAQAAVITFDATQNVVSPTLAAGDTAYNTGDAFVEAGFHLLASNNATAEPDEYGVVGALVDSDNAWACMLTACPVGTGSVYYAGLNDSSLTITNTLGPGWFQISGLQYAFVAPLNGLANFSYGRLLLTGTTMTGATIVTGGDFPGQNAAGRFTFDELLLDSAFSNTTLTSLTINACLFNADGDCTSVRAEVQNQAQFAIDNVTLTAIPEPASYALMLLGMAGLTVASRRRSK